MIPDFEIEAATLARASSRPRVGDYMTPCPDTVDIDAPLMEARRFMQRQRIRHLPVVDGNRLAGLLTDRDIKLLLGPDFDYPPPGDLKVRDAYTDSPYVVDYDSPLEKVVAEMSKRRIGSALVTRDGDLTGIFTATDALRVLAETLRDSPSVQAG